MVSRVYAKRAVELTGGCSFDHGQPVVGPVVSCLRLLRPIVHTAAQDGIRDAVLAAYAEAEEVAAAAQ